MEWRQMEAFAALAKHGSFTKAAEAVLRTQPAVSQQIKALEDELGCVLLERLGARGIRLTSEGESFLAFCRRALAERERLAEDLAAIRGEPRGRLTIAAPFTTHYQLLPSFLLKYRERFPQVEVTLLDRPQAEVFSLVRQGEVDLGLALASLAPADLARREWLEVLPGLLLPAGHALAKARKLNLKRLAGQPLILPPDTGPHSNRARLERLLADAGLKPMVVMESANVELSALYVEKGLGLCLATMARGAGDLKKRGLAFVSLAHALGADRLALVTRREKRLTAYQAAFLDMLLSGG